MPVTSPNGTYGLTVTDDQLRVWTFNEASENGKGWPILRDGLAVGGRGIAFRWWDGAVYAHNKSNLWVRWSDAVHNWINVPGGDPAAGILPPDNKPCILGDPIETEGEWGPCLVTRKQIQKITWTRPILQDPTGAGAPCGPTSGEYYRERECIYVPPVVDDDELPTKDQLMGMVPPAWAWTGMGAPQPRHIIEAQGHEFPTHDLDVARHIHIKTARPLLVSGIVPMWFDVTLFHCQGMRLKGFKFTWRGGARGIVYPSPAKPEGDGVWDLLITEHEQHVQVPCYIDTTPDDADGERAFEADLQMLREDGRIANQRLFMGTIRIANGRPTVTNVDGALGSEYWISSTPTLPAPFGYSSCNMRGGRYFINDPLPVDPVTGAPVPLQLHGQGRTNLRQVLAKAFMNPNLHTHPPNYGVGVMPLDAASPGVQLPSSGTLPSLKWKPINIQRPVQGVGDRLAFRVVDTGRDLAGNIVVPEGGGGALFIATMAPGSSTGA